MTTQTIDRGFLIFNYPPDVIYVINGQPVTKEDILEGKRQRQRRVLARKLYDWRDVKCPCFVWTFYNPGLIYGGWWLYVQTAKNGLNITNREMILKIMDEFPCGYLPVIENFDPWKAEFARIYHRPIKNRPDKNGMALARAHLSHNGRLLSVERTVR